VQNVAAVGRKFLTPSDQDENAVLYWVPDYWRLAGKWVEGSIQFRSSISFEDLKVHLVDNNIKNIESIEIAGKTHNQIMIWLEEQISKLGLKAVDLTMNLPYELPEYSFQKGDPFASLDHEIARKLGDYYHNSFVVLSKIIEQYKNTFAIRVWPHHFDQAFTILVKDSGEPDTSTYVSAGMAPGDDYYDFPYFYVNSWPHAEVDQLPEENGLGTWHIEDWVGKVLPCTELWELEDQEKRVESFYIESINQLLGILLQ
jgi:hypothetical protein